MKKQGICVAVFLALYQVLGPVGDHRALAAEDAASAAAINSAPAGGEAPALNDPMTRQTTMGTVQETDGAGGANAASQVTGNNATSRNAVGQETSSNVPRNAMPNDDVMGQSDQGNQSLLPEDNQRGGEELFGIPRGVVHPYVAVSAEYTDNLYNLDKQRVDNLLVSVNPGIWLSLPGKKEIPVTLALNNASGGGYQYEMGDYGRSDRLQLFLLGDVDYRMYSDDSNLDEVFYRLQGFARYNFPGGLSLQLLDAYTRNQDRFNIGHPDSQLTHAFDSNSVMGTIDWLFTEKLQAVLDLSLFSLSYDEYQFSYLERNDFALDLHFFFHATDKTALFLEYKYIDSRYDSNTLFDSTSNLYYIGVTWNSTEKLSFLARVGLRDKIYDSSQFSGWNGFVCELQTTYRLTDKSKTTLNLYRQNEETDMIQAEDKIVLGATLGYNLDITDKISFGITGLYEHANYRSRFGNIDPEGFSYYVAPDGSEEYNRKDDRFAISPRIDYLFTEWLKVGIGYRYEQTDSNISIYDYYSNTVFIDMKVAL